MSTGMAKGNQGDALEEEEEESEWLHTLDMEDIKEAQAQNDAALTCFHDLCTKRFKSITEETGIYLGFKLHPGADIKWLGGGAAFHCNNQLNLGSFLNDQTRDNLGFFPAFQQLKRRGLLPGKCRVSVDDPKQQVWVQKIWDGECVYYNYPDDYNKDGVMFELIATTVQDEKLAQFTALESKKSDHCPLLTLLFHPELEESMDFNQKELLTSRFIHLFFRQYAYMVPLDVLGLFLSPRWEQVLTSKKRKEDYLDWKILQADLTLNLPVSVSDAVSPLAMAKEIHSCLMDVGQALASLKRWEEAAPLYLEIAETFQCDLWSYPQAGLAMQYSGDLEGAFNTYIMALCRKRKLQRYCRPDLDEFWYSSMLCNLLQAHHAKFEGDMLSQDPNNQIIGGNKKNVWSAIAYLALLIVTKHNLVTEESLSWEIEPYFHISPGSARYTLQDKYQKPKEAKRVLLRLVQSTSLGDYYGTLHSVLRPNAPIYIQGVDDEESQDLRQFLADDTAKRALQNIKNKAPALSCCANCGKWSGWEEAFDRCPCRKVYYCTVDCQNAHWAKHKKFCTWKKDKKKNRNKNRKQAAAEVEDLLACSSCGKLNNKSQLKWCPCHQECYCCKPCQVSDWTDHKKVCPWFLHKKKK